LAVTFPLPADLPTDWAINQTVSPSGTDVGLSRQHGYNYLNAAVNAAQEGINQNNQDLSDHEVSLIHVFQATAALTPSGALELTGGLPADKDGLTVQFVSPAAATDGLQMKFAGSDALYPILTTGEGKEPIQAGAWGQGVPVTLTVSGGSCFFKGGGAGFPAGWNEKGQGIAWDDITKNSPIVQREYGKIEDGLQALPGPDVLPTGLSLSCDFSLDGNFLVVGHMDSPYITIYKRNGDTFTKLPDPSVLPGGNAYDCAFSPDGGYLAVAHMGSPYITIYKRSEGDRFVKLANPAILPPGEGLACTFSHDSTYLVIGSSESPSFIIYKRNGDIFSKLPNLPNLPSGWGYCSTFGFESTYLAIGAGMSPYFAVYKRTGDTFAKIKNPVEMPREQVDSCVFSLDGVYLALGHHGTPYITVYKREDDNFTKLQALPSPPSNTVYGCNFSSDNNYLALTYDDPPFLSIYRREEDSFVKIPDLPELTGRGADCVFSQRGGYLAIGYAKSPYLTIYLNEQKTYIHTLNDINKEYFAYAPKGKIGVAKESKPAGELVKATLFPALYNLTNEGGN
jgi:WD40 repeat protein